MIDSFTLVSVRSIGHDALRSVVRLLSIPAAPAKASAAAPQSLVGARRQRRLDGKITLSDRLAHE
jgi:hypothetical protein